VIFVQAIGFILQIAPLRVFSPCDTGLQNYFFGRKIAALYAIRGLRMTRDGKRSATRCSLRTRTNRNHHQPAHRPMQPPGTVLLRTDDIARLRQQGGHNSGEGHQR
jgi:hypothetical protein